MGLFQPCRVDIVRVERVGCDEGDEARDLFHGSEHQSQAFSAAEILQEVSRVILAAHKV